MLSVLGVLLLPAIVAFLSIQAPGAGCGLFPVLTAFVVLPILAGLVIMLAPSKWSRWLALGAASLEIGIAFKLLLLFLQSPWLGYQYVEDVPWLPYWGIHYSLGLDGFSLLMMVLTAAVFAAGVLVSWNISVRPKEYFLLFCLVVGGVAGAYLSLSLFFFFLFYEFDILPMYLLIGIWGNGRKEYAAMKLTLYLLAGSALMFVGFLAMFFGSCVHTFDIRVLSNLSQTGFTTSFQETWFPLLFIGFGVISALVPFHTWTPVGYSSAPTGVSMLNAGILKNLGAYGILRIALPSMPIGAHQWLSVFALLALLNMLYAAFVAMKQKDLKYTVAYSSISHCGTVLFGVCAFQVTALTGAVIQMLSQGIVAAMTFALVGLTEERTGTREISKLGGLCASLPVIGGLFMAACMANVGLPGLSGFVGEFLVYLGAYDSGFNGGFLIYKALFVISVAAIVLTAIYFLRLIQNVYFGPIPKDSYRSTKDGDFVEVLPIALLLALSLAIGLYPKPFVDIANTTIASMVAQMGAFK